MRLEAPREMAEELGQVALLRAEAYYAEQPRSRFVKSFMKQFAEGEVASLRRRTQLGPNSPPECVCLVAVQPDPAGNSQVVGTMDVRPPASQGGRHPMGVPEKDSEGAYAYNVVVAAKHRGKGFGKALLQEAARLARANWHAQRMYAHVAADNEIASGVYRCVGFCDAAAHLGGNTANFDGALKLGREILLQKDL
ncbi:hypothetical protein WJX72_007215 [[Myrmecia] bisecta]|uniref:N-acetyltransferase domain-containing protein n=1 Tax=[Myrmecia] bisecta TaxID=41462 RepID=A0AAW1PAW7_9CHLO